VVGHVLTATLTTASSGYSNNLSSLKTSSLIVYSGPGMLSLTDAGYTIAVQPAERLTGIRVQEKVQQLVSRPQWAIIEALARAHPSDMDRTEAAEQSGQSPSSSGYSNNLSSLKSMGFVEYSAPGRIKAASLLFIS
jgi:hypothetical protein